MHKKYTNYAYRFRFFDGSGGTYITDATYSDARIALIMHFDSRLLDVFEKINNLEKKNNE